jgi:hypothetical protein
MEKTKALTLAQEAIQKHKNSKDENIKQTQERYVQA